MRIKEKAHLTRSRSEKYPSRFSFSFFLSSFLFFFHVSNETIVVRGSIESPWPPRKLGTADKLVVRREPVNGILTEGVSRLASRKHL